MRILPGALISLALVLFFLALAIASPYLGSPDNARAAGSVIDTISVPCHPHGIAVNPLTNVIYAADTDGGRVSVINGSTNTVATTIFDGNVPLVIGVNPSTNRAYVTKYDVGTVEVINTTNNTVVTGIGVGVNPKAIAVNQATNRIYVAQYNNPGTVTVIDGATNSVVTTVSVGINPTDVAVNSTTNLIYTANTSSDDVSVINGSSNTVVDSFPVTAPNGIAVNETTNRIYVSTQFDNVKVFNGVDNSLIATIPVSGFPNGIAVNESTNSIYTANSSSNTVSILDGATNTLTSSVAVGTGPYELDVNPNTSRIYVDGYYSCSVTVIEDLCGGCTPGPTVSPSPTSSPSPTPCGCSSATFTVHKDFMPDSNAAVSITLACSGGTVDLNPRTATEISPAQFTVTGFGPGTVCSATESPVPNGYTRNDAACQLNSISDGGAASCTITNTLATPTPTPTPTATPTPTPCVGCTPTPTATATPSPTPTPHPTPTPEPEETTAAVGPGGGTVTTGDTPTVTDPIETSVVVPAGTSGGTVQILEGGYVSSYGQFVLLGQEAVVHVNVTGMTASNPLSISFSIDASFVPSGETKDSITVFKDGVAVPNCATFPTTGPAAPDPCVSNREDIAGGDVRITILTSTASTWDFAATDSDSDGVSNGGDNCPQWPNPAQALPAWPVPAGDSDCDGFPDSVAIAPPNALASEAGMGTDAAGHCASTTGTNPAFRNDEPPPDRWPVDFDDNGQADGSDLLTFAPVFGTIGPDPPYDPRFDLNNDVRINGSDLLKFAPFFGKHCA